MTKPEISQASELLKVEFAKEVLHEVKEQLRDKLPPSLYKHAEREIEALMQEWQQGKSTGSKGVDYVH